MHHKKKQMGCWQLHHPLATLTHLSNTMDYDWSQHALDEAVPDILDHLRRRERFAPMLEHARQQGMTLRQFTKCIGGTAITFSSVIHNIPIY
ncbi:hypothetical protein ACOZB2_28225 [Pantoea endophytica]|uniref:Uncharacterized protein n=1 Tax=Pantoea sp. BJ2 TaxID=3141322 RepID=A0AAU7U3W9_9GAMM